MQHETTQAPCAAPSLQQVIQRLKDEKAQVNAALGVAPFCEWGTPAVRALCNREQELHTTLGVLENLGAQPMQIAEPAASIEQQKSELEAIAYKYAMKLQDAALATYISDVEGAARRAKQWLSLQLQHFIEKRMASAAQAPKHEG